MQLLLSVVDDCMCKLHLSLSVPLSLPITSLLHTLKNPLKDKSTLYLQFAYS